LNSGVVSIFKIFCEEFGVMSRKKRKLRALRVKEEVSRDQNSTRRLTGGLVFSGALNIALATSLIYFAVKAKDTPPPSSFTSSMESGFVLDLSREISLQSAMEQYLSLDFESLVALLKKKDSVEGGLSQRDLALSTLAFKYDFDAKRALLGQETETNAFPLDPNKEVTMPIYMGLTDAQYRLVHSFLKTEQWPYTSSGLFNRITEGQSEKSLKEAFFLTKEFMLLEALFCPISLPKEDLLKLMTEGPWNLVQNFVDSKPLVENFSNPLRIHFLCQYLDSASDEAASLILKVDPEYALNKLSDDKVVALLGLLENKTELTQNFVLHIALGSRSDWVKQEACRLLYHYSNREFIHPFNYQSALDFIAHEFDLCPNESPALDIYPIQGEQESSMTIQIMEQPLVSSAEPHRIYTVQKGDCLSKIAKKHQIEIKELKAANHLDNDLIQVGTTLLIP